MLRLVFVVCMLDAPDTCENRELLIHDDVPLMACMTGAMPELALWRQTHPNWRVNRWRCEDDRMRNSGEAVRKEPVPGTDMRPPT